MWSNLYTSVRPKQPKRFGKFGKFSASVKFGGSVKSMIRFFVSVIVSVLVLRVFFNQFYSVLSTFARKSYYDSDILPQIHSFYYFVCSCKK